MDPLLLWAGTGLIVGTLMGFTGAGGALASVPIFVHIGKYSIQEATTFSLFAVLFGAALGWWVQRKITLYAIALPLTLFSSVGAAAFYPIKRMASEGLLRALFISVCLLSFWGLWKKRSSLIPNRTPQFQWSTALSSAVLGFFVGGIVTLTGLGGGIILVPLLAGLLRLPLHQATVTSLFIMGITAISSLSTQKEIWLPLVSLPTLGALFLGTGIAALGIKNLVLKVPPLTLERVRRILVSAVILVAVISLF